ncbi:hypothetical protein CMEL01_13525 [Colletotrichum melonis]|uniref:Uncharacterized protein n=1 Tax=Colletotrichum melonis TaxID=1209925 RepID=A0AAI9UV23_9PEZI|nr:hypothetical protein CMEL01_13525 [Colletotrichum melonis]
MRRLPGATFAIVDIITFHHSDHVHDRDLDLDRFGKAAQPTEAVPTVWSLSAPATAPVLAPAAPNMLIDIIEMPSTGVQMGTHPSDKSRSPMACHYDSIRLRLIGRVLGPSSPPPLRTCPASSRTIASSRRCVATATAASHPFPLLSRAAYIRSAYAPPTRSQPSTHHWPLHPFRLRHAETCRMPLQFLLMDGLVLVLLFLHFSLPLTFCGSGSGSGILYLPHSPCHALLFRVVSCPPPSTKTPPSGFSSLPPLHLFSHPLQAPLSSEL